jgi:HEAT repeat protein
MLTEQAFKDKVNSLIKNAPDHVRRRFEEDVQLIYTNNINSYEQLLLAINDTSLPAQVREVASWLVSKIGDEDSLSKLLAASNDENPNIRSQAIQALGELKFASPEVLITLNQMISNDNNVEVRKTAAYSLGLLAHENGLDALMDTLGNREEDPTVRGMAAEALINFRDPSIIPLLITSLSDEAPEVRFWSAFALGQLGAVEALPELSRLVTEDHVEVSGWHSVSQEAADAIEAINMAMDNTDSESH